MDYNKLYQDLKVFDRTRLGQNIDDTMEIDGEFWELMTFIKNNHHKVHDNSHYETYFLNEIQRFVRSRKVLHVA